MVTLRELAERTGYSPATISRILNGDPSLSVTQEARKRVLEAAGSLNYAEMRSRRGRPSKRGLRIALAEMLSPAEQLADPYYLYLSGYIRQLCLAGKHTCIPLERRGALFFSPEEPAPDGIIAIGLFTPAQIQSLQAICETIVFVNSSPMESKFDSVVFNHPLGVSLAIEHLTDLGHRDIGFLGPVQRQNDQGQQSLEIRRQAFEHQMGAMGLLRPNFLLDCPMDAQAAANTMSLFWDSGHAMPTAVLCANEECAIGAARALRGKGVAIPDDLSLLSFNNTPRSALVDPPLTSISIDMEEMARAALRMLPERLNVQDRKAVRALPLKVVIPPTLVVRNSTAPPWEH